MNSELTDLCFFKKLPKGIVVSFLCTLYCISVQIEGLKKNHLKAYQMIQKVQPTLNIRSFNFPDFKHVCNFKSNLIFTFELETVHIQAMWSGKKRKGTMCENLWSGWYPTRCFGVIHPTMVNSSPCFSHIFIVYLLNLKVLYCKYAHKA